MHRHTPVSHVSNDTTPWAGGGILWSAWSCYRMRRGDFLAKSPVMSDTPGHQVTYFFISHISHISHSYPINVTMMIHFGGLIPKNGRNMFAEMSIHSLNFSIFGEIWWKSPRIPSKTLEFCPNVLISQEHERQGSLPRESPLLCGHGTGGGLDRVRSLDLWSVDSTGSWVWNDVPKVCQFIWFLICFNIVLYVLFFQQL